MNAIQHLAEAALYVDDLDSAHELAPRSDLFFRWRIFPGLLHDVEAVIPLNGFDVGEFGLAGSRVNRGRPRAPFTAAEDIGADDKIFIRIEGLARSDRIVPPARFAIVRRVPSGDVGVAGEGVADENRVAAIRVQGPVGLVRQSKRSEGCPALQAKLLVERHLLRVDDHDRHAPSLSSG